jgi:hypothetical protein
VGENVVTIPSTVGAFFFNKKYSRAATFAVTFPACDFALFRLHFFSTLIRFHASIASSSDGQIGPLVKHVVHSTQGHPVFVFGIIRARQSHPGNGHRRGSGIGFGLVIFSPLQKTSDHIPIQHQIYH